MFRRLQEKWKVGPGRLALILCTFAIGGSLCGRAAKWLLDAAGKAHYDWLWWLLYLALVTLLWPLCVMLISIPLGQFAFFRNYLRRMWERMRGGKKT